MVLVLLCIPASRVLELLNCPLFGSRAVPRKVTRLTVLVTFQIVWVVLGILLFLIRGFVVPSVRVFSVLTHIRPSVTLGRLRT